MKHFAPVFTLVCALSLIHTAAIAQSANKGTSVVIHDSTNQNNGGEGATQNLRNAIEAELKNNKPCVEPIDDQDIRDTINDERERNLLEGGDPTQTLQNLGNLMGSSYVMSVQATPGPGGASFYSVFVMDAATATTIARETGTDAKDVAKKIVGQLGPYLSNNCNPHWVGTIKYVSSFSESKQTDDKGAMRASAKNLHRVLTQTSNMQTNITANLLPPDGNNKSISSPKARVSQRTSFNFIKDSTTTGELQCREPGMNPYFKGFSESYTETTSQIGQGTEVLPIFISLDNDGSYSIKVTAPGGTLYGKSETRRQGSGCSNAPNEPTIDAIPFPEGRMESTSFDVEGQANPRNRDTLSGTKTLPDGFTTISWNLRLVKPKGKN